MKPLWKLVLAALAGAVVAGVWGLVSPALAVTLVIIAYIPFIPRPALRFLSSIFVLIAVIAAVADATPMVSAGEGFKATPLAGHWSDISPGSLQAAKAFVSKSSAAPWMWDSVIETVIGLPTFVLFGLLALIAGIAGRHRREVNIYTN